MRIFRVLKTLRLSVCVGMGALRVSFFLAGRRVSLRRVRDLLGLSVAHAAVRGDGWSALWGGEYGVLRPSGVWLADEKLGRLRQGGRVRVWGEVFEARDLVEVVVDGVDCGKAREALGRDSDWADWREGGDIRRLSGALSAHAVATALEEAGGARCSEAPLSCRELLELLRRNQEEQELI